MGISNCLKLKLYWTDITISIVILIANVISKRFCKVWESGQKALIIILSESSKQRGFWDNGEIYKRKCYDLKDFIDFQAIGQYADQSITTSRCFEFSVVFLLRRPGSFSRWGRRIVRGRPSSRTMTFYSRILTRITPYIVCGWTKNSCIVNVFTQNNMF